MENLSQLGGQVTALLLSIIGVALLTTALIPKNAAALIKILKGLGDLFTSALYWAKGGPAQ